jgi:hypothetical protein
MKTQLLITIEHPDDVPANQFIDIAIKSLLNDIDADCEEGWSVSYTDIQPRNYQFLQDYALKCSLEHHLCNVEELIDEGLAPADILALVEDGKTNSAKDSPYALVYEQYEWSSHPELVNEIEDARGVHLFNFSELLKEINGEQWFTNFKEGK